MLESHHDQLFFRDSFFPFLFSWPSNYHHHPVKCNHLPNIIFLFFTPNPVTLFITPSKLINSTTNRLAHHQALPTYEQVSITRNLNSKNCLLTTSSTAPKFPANLLFFVKLYYHPLTLSPIWYESLHIQGSRIKCPPFLSSNSKNWRRYS